MLRYSIAVLLGLVLAVEVQAQQVDRRIPDGSATGLTVDRFSIPEYDDRYTTFTLHASDLRAGRLGTDLAVGLFPQFLMLAQLTAATDFGVGYNISLPRVTILPHLGPTAFVSVGPYARVAFIGVQAGASILLNFAGTSAIRLDLTRREYLGNNSKIESSLTFGIGISGVRPRKRAGAK